MHDQTKQENQETIHLLEVFIVIFIKSLEFVFPVYLQEKIHDLERKTELQSLKHEEILLEFESLKARRDRILPSSTRTILSNSHPNSSSLLHHRSVPTMIDSQTSPIAENVAPFSVSQPSTIQQGPLLKSTGSQSVTTTDNQDIQQKSILNNQTIQIVVAKYSYEPLQCSPNDHPEVELPLNIGEYYLIYGDVDEVNKVSFEWIN